MTALTHLSLYRVGFRATPHVPSNDDRIRAYRAFQPVQYGNATFAQRYAAEAAPGEDYDNDLREGFALKYGSSK